MDLNENQVYDLGVRNGMNETRALVTMARKFLNEKGEQIPGEMDAIEQKFFLGGGHTALDILEALIQASLAKRVAPPASRGADSEV